VPVLEPVPGSQAVSRYSLAGGLWRPLATLLIGLDRPAGLADAA
jgi:hypothetical protein